MEESREKRVETLFKDDQSGKLYKLLYEGPHSCIYARVFKETTRASLADSVFSPAYMEPLPSCWMYLDPIVHDDDLNVTLRYIHWDELLSISSKSVEDNQNSLNCVHKYVVKEEQQLTLFLAEVLQKILPYTQR